MKVGSRSRLLHPNDPLGLEKRVIALNCCGRPNHAALDKAFDEKDGILDPAGTKRSVTVAEQYVSNKEFALMRNVGGVEAQCPLESGRKGEVATGALLSETVRPSFMRVTA